MMSVYGGDILRQLLYEADREGYAIPMFDYSDLWDQLAIIEAAEELHAPVMFASLPKGVNEIGIEMLGAMGIASMKKASVPVFHHLDHAIEVKMCCDAIDHGYASVMIDASKEELEANICASKAVVAYAAPHKVFVEAEIGRIKGRDYEGIYEGDDFLAKVSDAVRLAAETGIDALAVGIGTAHGFYEGKPELNFRRLAEINEATKIPLVLHGGTGIPEEDVQKAIKNGINKVNVGTQIRCAYMQNAHRVIGELGYKTHTVDIMHEVKKAIKEEVKMWIKICMADGKV